MNERDLRSQIADVKTGRLSRREFVQRMIAVGLTAPMAGAMLAHSGVVQAAEPITYKPTKAGGGGPLKLLFWQAPTLLNPHFANGTKDQEASRLFYEPLAGWDADGNLVPILAAEIPSKENGLLAADGLSVTWKLKQGVKWHDGKPFTADDVIFNWEYSVNPDTAAVSVGSYRGIKSIDKIDDYTVKLNFKQPTPFWADPFVAAYGLVIPKHLFADYIGAKSREAPTNLKPVGTGPYVYVDFKPGDSIAAKRNPDYHQANRPYFDTVEVKGGGDAVSAARAVLQTGEYDYAYNLQVEDEILTKLEAGGQGRAQLTVTGHIEYIALNTTDPWTEVDGERSSVKTKHPFFTDPAVRKAINLLIDRASVQKFIYGRAGVATANFLNNPERFRSPNNKFEFSIEKANQILEEAGWKKNSSGIREKDGKPIKLVFQTSINAPRQKNQAIIKQAFQKAGIEVELKSVVASVFFSSDPANPDTYPHFYCDMEMYQTTMPQADPQFFMNQFTSWEVSTKENKWQGRNISRWRNKEYDETYKQASSELDPVKRAALFIKLNDLVVQDNYILPEINRRNCIGLKNGMVANKSGWDNDLWQIANWYRET
ncbi:peptide ABC transporter substrate-binding protein [Bradyrhizobium sp. 83012]|uniref:Peptide ABC transporter substrate-binding protein n=1 Tax=Bradyrhizobium aeschynomenes TaxID=2734909 RepID=A0ABX2CCB4_9BRAD|nr:peptide ABC transporter substrate-binding protein [Bradyrhizobium aeschynomenes]NPU14017.1 peptide ABC transporter substrate-binding protein [Bradyrhizobium aeschynomenes]NPU64932.1 peptide ABC transporter substrate-binding protein [Bradyrhizobium aeschynomenes]NPV25302.1 peptide ABC transporter substrate-binding protein [Bradyrhizobium aeschynomenes]